MFKSINMSFSAFLITCLLIKLNSAAIRPASKLSITEDEGFVAYLDVGEKFGALENCWFQFKDEAPITLDLNSQQPQTAASGEHILPFSEKICGVRVSNVSSTTAGKWSLSAQSQAGLNETGSIILTILTAPKLRLETTIHIENGDGYLSCSKDSYTSSCQLKNLENGQTWDSCSISTVLKANMQFECLMFNEGRLGYRKELIEIENLSKNPLTVASIESTADHIYLRCKGPSNFGKCRAQKPQNGVGLSLEPGLYDGRFSAFDTDNSKSLCTLDILKPLQENEVGVWRIISSKTSAGCLYYVGDTKQNIIQKELNSLNKLQKLEIYNTSTKIEQMSLTVPFIATACYLRSPNNNLYYPDAYQFERTSQHGNCIVKNLPVESGIWVFGVIGPDYDGEFTQSINVVVKPKLGEVLTNTVHEQPGGAVEFMCKSPFGEPIDKCAFINPLNEVTLAAVNKFTKTTGRIKYFGRGVQNGECGIKVVDLQTDDFGEWICQFVVLTGERKTSLFKMQLVQKDQAGLIGQATTLGLSVGASTIVAVVGSLVLLSIYFKRRSVRQRQSITSNDPLEMVATREPSVAQ